MANGFYMAQGQPIDYRGTAQAGGAALGGLMGGVQQGMEMAQSARMMQMKEQQFQAEQEAAQTAAAKEQQMNALAMQAAQGDPEAQQQLMALNPQIALQMQQVQGAQQEQELKQQEAQREAVGAIGSLLSSGSSDMVDSTYERVVAKIRKEGDHESEVGLPSREEWAKLSQKEKVDVSRKVGRQLEDFSMGPEQAAERRFKETEAERKAATPKDVRTALQKNLEAAGLKPGTKEYKEAMVAGSKMGTTVTIGPQTESQRKDDFLAGIVDNSLSEMQSALETFDPTSMKTAIVGKLPLANFFKSEAHQQFNSAARPIIEAYLVKITGAAYSEIQQSGAIDTYLPQPGDKPGTVNAKINRIKSFAKSMKKSAGYAVDEAVPEEKKDITKLSEEEKEQVPQPAAPAGDISTMSNEDILRMLGQ